MLTQISLFWFAKTRAMCANHLSGLRVEDVVADAAERAQLAGRAMVVKKLQALPHRSRGARLSDRLGLQGLQAAWLGLRHCPARRAADGGPLAGTRIHAGLQSARRPARRKHRFRCHGEIDRTRIRRPSIRRIALDIYRFASEHARARNIIIADTKFEFGVDKAGRLYLIDEALTPDSSRFWPMASYKAGISPPSFDKQFVRDYLESLHWNKKPPAPHLPPEILARTSENYREALRLLTAD